LLHIIDWLHHKKIVHRDIRIPNVMIEEDQIKLINFGLARRFIRKLLVIEEPYQSCYEIKQDFLKILY